MSESIDDILQKIDGSGLPEEFTETVYSPGELMRRLDVEDESQFWLAYRSGRIPHGVWLPTDEPIVVWDRQHIETWIDAGCPVDPTILAHNVAVIRRLEQIVWTAATTGKPENN